MASSDRLIQLLGLFSTTQPVLTPARAMAALDASRASVYRYLRQLEAAGFVERVPERGYVLGPAIVELDRQIRITDPLLEAADGLIDKLSAETGGTVLLCRFHGNKVLCIEQAVGPQAPASISYERGRGMPLYRGATSRIILAFLRRPVLESLWQRYRKEMVKAGLPGSFEALCAALAPLREARYCETAGEVDRDARGFATPILDGARVLGSLSVVLPASTLKPSQHARIVSLLMTAGAQIEARVESTRFSARQKKFMEKRK
jgi:DNA-binding IclR family transcriptional regulator